MRGFRILMNVISSAQQRQVSKIFHMLRITWLMDQLQMVIALRKEDSKSMKKDTKDLKNIMKTSSKQSKACAFISHTLIALSRVVYVWFIFSAE